MRVASSKQDTVSPATSIGFRSESKQDCQPILPSALQVRARPIHFMSMRTVSRVMQFCSNSTFVQWKAFDIALAYFSTTSLSSKSSSSTLTKICWISSFVYAVTCAVTKRACSADGIA